MVAVVVVDVYGTCMALKHHNKQFHHRYAAHQVTTINKTIQKGEAYLPVEVVAALPDDIE